MGGRVFSGKIGTGKKCRIMGPNYVVGKRTDLHVKPIQRTCIMMGRSVDQVDDVPCGNTCALVGVDAYLLKSGTITDGDATDCHNISVTETGPQCLSKSANKHNRIFLHAEPLDDDLINFIMEDKFRMNLNEKDRTEFMRENFDWDRKETKTIWALGPDGHGPNMIKNETSGVQYLLEIKESVVQGFNWATGCGPLAEEEMQVVRFNLEDVTMHADSIHRGMGQIFPPTRRCMYAALMMSAPSLLEPMYLAEITAPMSVVGGIYSTLSKRRGITQGEYPRPGTPLTVVKAFLPVAESFGFTAALRSNTGGQAFPQCVFDHWNVVTGNAMTGGMSHDIVLKIRKRKGIAADIPPLDRYLDKL